MTESFHEWLRRSAKKKSRFFTRFAREAGIDEKSFSKTVNGYSYPSGNSMLTPREMSLYSPRGTKVSSAA